jgi:hypothetical protein
MLPVEHVVRVPRVLENSRIRRSAEVETAEVRDNARERNADLHLEDARLVLGLKQQAGHLKTYGSSREFRTQGERGIPRASYRFEALIFRTRQSLGVAT